MIEQLKNYTTKQGDKIWYLPSKGENSYHRLDGPAFEGENGSKHWFVDGKLLPIIEVEEWLEENDIDLSTEEGQIAFKLRWS